MRRETSDGQTERGDLSFGVPQGFAQLLSGEGACVTFYTLESLERGDTVLGDFSTSLRCARNDSSARASAFPSC